MLKAVVTVYVGSVINLVYMGTWVHKMLAVGPS